MAGLDFLLFLLIALGQIEAIRFGSGATLYVHDIVVGMMVLSVFLSMEKRKTVFMDPLTKPIIILSAVLTASLVFNITRVTASQFLLSSGYLIRFILYAGLYWYAVASKKGAGIINGLFLSGTAVSLIGLIQLLLYPDLRNLYYMGWDPHFYRVFSTFLDPNFTGLFLVLTFFLGLYLNASRPGNRFIQVSLFLISAAILLTYSRSSFLAFFGGLAAMSIMNGKIRPIITAALVFALFLIIPKPNIIGFDLFRTETIFSRIGNLSEGYRLFTRSPFIGYGFNTLRYTSGLPAEEGILSHARAGLDNSFMFLLVTAGIAGLAAFAYLGMRLISVILRLKDTKMKQVLFASIAAVFLHSQFVNSLFYPFVLIWIFLVMGSAENAGAGKIGKQESHRRQPLNKKSTRFTLRI